MLDQNVIVKMYNSWQQARYWGQQLMVTGQLGQLQVLATISLHERWDYILIMENDLNVSFVRNTDKELLDTINNYAVNKHLL